MAVRATQLKLVQLDKYVANRDDCFLSILPLPL